MSEVHAITNHWLVAVGHGMTRVMTTIEVMIPIRILTVDELALASIEIA